MMLGVAALAVSAGGAVTMGEADVFSGDDAQFRYTSQASALNGASAVSAVGSRGDQVSRDSSRDAQADSAAADLQAAVEKQAVARNAELSELAAAAEKQAAKIKANNWILPVQGYRLTNTFGIYASYYAGYHTGLDFAAPYGSPVVSIARGVVVEAGYDGSYGYNVIVRLDDGTEIQYAHLDHYTVSVGEELDQGDVLGALGSTGNSTGPHVHIEVRPGGGDAVDPYPAFLVHGITP